MDLVRRTIALAGVALLIASPPVVGGAQPPFCGTQQWQPLIEEAAAQFAIPASWIHAVMRVESAGCTMMNGRPTVSSAGAMGLMQLTPMTWAMLRHRLALGADPHDPRDNILAGAAYLAELYERYGMEGAFAAYHAGPHRYDQHLNGTRSLPAATRSYTARVQRLLGSVRETPPPGTPADSAPTRDIFVGKRHDSRADTRHAEQPIPRPLFVPRTRDGTRMDRAAAEARHVQHAE